MSWINSKMAIKIFGITFIFSAITGLVSTILILAVGVLTQHQIKMPNVQLLQGLQRHFYFSGYRDIWQYMDECVTLNDQLIYIPKVGVCQFRNLEFSTSLGFNKDGRTHRSFSTTEQDSIAVLGDSFAMGWGVGDNETYSAILEHLTNRKVYNFGVSSYATEREMLRLIRSSRSNNISTIIIQYCMNDYKENMSYPIDLELGMQRYSAAMNVYTANQSSTLYRSFFAGYKILAKNLLPQFIVNVIRSYRAGSIDKGPIDHVGGVMHVLDNYADYLHGKRVIVFYLNSHNKDSRHINDVSFNDWSQSVTRADFSVEFIDLDLQDNHFFDIDGHLNKNGNAEMARRLYLVLEHNEIH